MSKDGKMSARISNNVVNPSAPLEVIDKKFYCSTGFFENAPLFSPWLSFGEFGETLARSGSLHPPTRLYYIYQFLLQSVAVAPGGDIFECGVFRGDSAAFIASALLTTKNKFHLFDTFSGMPHVRPDKDIHSVGDFSDTSFEFVKQRIMALGNQNIMFHPGVIPETFNDLAVNTISFAHIDLDVHDAILAALDYIFPRLIVGGFIVFDDYGWLSCPGAREAVDNFFSNRPERVIVLPTGQSFIVKAAL